MRRDEDISIRPSTSLRYAQDERGERSVRAERNPQGEVEAWTAISTNDLGNLYM
jgi:hypothetical protein